MEEVVCGDWDLKCTLSRSILVKKQGKEHWSFINCKKFCVLMWPCELHEIIFFILWTEIKSLNPQQIRTYPLGRLTTPKLK